MTVAGVALTFDDGPDPVWTPRLLDMLAALRAHATFFPIAPRAAAAPELIERMRADGHTIGLHCDEHIRHSTRGADWGRHDTASALARLHALHVSPSLWRTPWGDLAPWSRRVAAENALDIVGWSTDTEDWRGDPAAVMFARTRAALADGAVVLAHDGIGPGARRADAAQTLAYVKLVGAYAVDRGLTLEALA